MQYLVVPNDALNDSKKETKLAQNVLLMERETTLKRFSLEISSINVGIIHSSYSFRSVLIFHIRHIRTHARTLHVYDVCVCVYACACVCVFWVKVKEWLFSEIQFVFTCAPL